MYASRKLWRCVENSEIWRGRYLCTCMVRVWTLHPPLPVWLDLPSQSLPTNRRVKDYKKRILLPLLISLIWWSRAELTYQLRNAILNAQGPFSGLVKDLQTSTTKRSKPQLAYVRYWSANTVLKRGVWHSGGDICIFKICYKKIDIGRVDATIINDWNHSSMKGGCHRRQDPILWQRRHQTRQNHRNSEQSFFLFCRQRKKKLFLFCLQRKTHIR